MTKTKSYHMKGVGILNWDDERAVAERREFKMYGMPEKKILAGVVNANLLVEPITEGAVLAAINMYAMGLLSDAQELPDDPEYADNIRLILNRAKYCMSIVHNELRKLERLKK